MVFHFIFSPFLPFYCLNLLNHAAFLHLFPSFSVCVCVFFYEFICLFIFYANCSSEVSHYMLSFPPAATVHKTCLRSSFSYPNSLCKSSSVSLIFYSFYSRTTILCLYLCLHLTCNSSRRDH